MRLRLLDSYVQCKVGIGGIADSISKRHVCELVGFDLSYGVDGAYKNFHDNIFFHIVQASAFFVPFTERTFDYIYSHEVLHHSSDPKTCFMNISKLAKTYGYLYVWLYSDSSEKVNLIRRILMLSEQLLRPIIWLLAQKLQNIILFPLALLYIIHQNFQIKKDPNLVKDSLREAYHVARDRFTPRQAFRYTNEQLTNWFYSAGYDNLLYSNKRDAADHITYLFSQASAIIGQKK